MTECSMFIKGRSPAMSVSGSRKLTYKKVLTLDGVLLVETREGALPMFSLSSASTGMLQHNNL